MKTIRKTVTILAAVCALAVVMFWMSGGFKHKIEPGKVEAEPRRVGDLPTDKIHAIVEMETAEVVGTLRAQRRTDISAKIMATIADIPVKAGEKVKKGQVLVRLDDRDMQARVEQAKKALEAAQAQAKQLGDDLKRYAEVLKAGAMTKQQYDQQEAAYKVAQANVERAQQAVREAEVALSYTVIEAPTDGVVVDKNADKGDTAAPGQPLLTLYDPSQLRLEAPVRETLATTLHVGDSLRVKIEALDLEVEGRVDEIVPQAEAASRSVLVKVAVPKHPRMVEGQFGRLSIPTGQRRRLCMPLSAVVRVGQLTFCDAVTTGGVLERRPIKLGEHSEFGRIEVISGLKAGDVVALYGPPPEAFPEKLPGGRYVEEEPKP
ncbi:MAG: efflux RND transporter periplasmic adaptor subunit [Candidatus Sumerlaeia bacterium]|nr:efflux RND transporter periplasmic adaptor subunit [Candidatus Sumerlaeia bacterium]